MSTLPSTVSPHSWRFACVGGLDLVQLQSAEDLRHLPELDQKLWTALACPVKGLEFDERTLAMIDGDGDGRVRAPEIIAAVRWSCEVLQDPAILIKGGDSLPLDAIKDAGIRASAEKILSSLGKDDAKAISLGDASDTAAIFAKTVFNGDGIILPAAAGADTALAQTIEEIIATQGGDPDRSGKTGISAAKVTAFHSELAAYAAWAGKGEDDTASIMPLGDATADALSALDAVRTKIDDFFARCRLAAFDARALGALNRQESEFLAIAAQDLSITNEEIKGFPLAKVEAGRALPLVDGINPAWASLIAAFKSKVADPLLGTETTALSDADWATLQAKLAPFRGWVAGKAGTSVESLGITRVRELLKAPPEKRLLALIESDLAVAPEFDAILNVERLVRYQRDLFRLLQNFVAFSDFYSPDRLAVFQAGTLYLDSRACELVVKVADPAKHAAMAGLAKAYLAYCDCTRPSTGEKMTIAAAFMDGDSDRLMVGRNGIFYDRKGQDWDATITKVIENPISIREAFWAPYKKFVRMIEEQAAKRAAAADAASQGKLSAAAESTANVGKAPAPTEPKKFDVGTIAALGVAVSGIVAVLTAIIAGILGLSWWQIPLAVIGVLLFISTPSMIIAALKLRQRNLGPILDANGWAVNGRVKINIPFGTSLTEMARLPAGSTRTLKDPYAEKRSPWRSILVLLVLIALVMVGIRWDHNRRGHYFWETAPEVPVAIEAVDTEAAAAAVTPPAETP